VEETFDLKGVEAGSLGQAGGLGNRITVNMRFRIRSDLELMGGLWILKKEYR
jgi:hypothetical protein